MQCKDYGKGEFFREKIGTRNLVPDWYILR